jgi:hypothetical protein
VFGVPATQSRFSGCDGRRPAWTSARDDERAEIVIDPWRPKAIAGERVWVPDGSTWVKAHPKPEFINGELIGTTCARRQHHNMMDIASGWTVCLD